LNVTLMNASSSALRTTSTSVASAAPSNVAATVEPERDAPSVTNPIVTVEPSAPSTVAQSSAAPNPSNASAPRYPPLPPAPDYFFTSKLQISPQPLSAVEPEFPDRLGKQSGVVTLRILINESGVVDNVAVVDATPVGVFEDSALAAWGRANFAPGRIAGKPVKSQVTIEVVFDWVMKNDAPKLSDSTRLADAQRLAF
jgi:periplasmic protein TonB